MSTAISGTNGITFPDGGVERGPLTRSASVTTTSGTSIDVTGIPSWAKRVTIILNGVSTSGISPLQVQLGGGSIETTGYDATGSSGGSGLGTSNATTGFILESAAAASGTRHANIIITNISGNTWVSSHTGSAGTVYSAFIGGGGSKTIAAVLDRIRLTTINGTDTFDAGLIAVLWE